MASWTLRTSHEEKALLLQEQDYDEYDSRPPARIDAHRPRCRCTSRVATIALAISLLLNFVLLFISVRQRYREPPPARTAFAGLDWDLSVPWVAKSPFYGEKTVEDADMAWDGIAIENGTVALDPSYAETMGLLPAEKYPLEGGAETSKGTYVLNGYHSMHCLKTIRTWIRQATQQLPTSLPSEYMLECLDALRQDVECYADDTPRYTGLQERGRSGTGQLRQCRDWKALEAWAQQHTAGEKYSPEAQPPRGADGGGLEGSVLSLEDPPPSSKGGDLFGDGNL